jgi:hydrogenase nickel incorporation protein HypA/HybF
MHEQSIVESFLRLALESAQKADANRIIKISLVVGELSGVVDEAVNFSFRFLSRDTIAEGAVISFSHIPARFRCRKCNSMFTPLKMDYSCPNCKDQQIEIVAGRELYIDSMEVD